MAGLAGVRRGCVKVLVQQKGAGEQREEDVSICEGEIIWINLTAINRRTSGVGGRGVSGDGDDVCKFRNLYTHFSRIKRRFNPKNIIITIFYSVFFP